MQWAIKAANLEFPALNSGYMSFIFLDFSIASHMPLLFLRNTITILKFTQVLMNTMYMRARVGRKGERGQIYKEGEVEREIGKVEVTCFCSDYL